MTKKNKLKLTVVVIVLSVAVIVGGIVLVYENPSRVVASVGDYKITQKEKVLRDEVHKVFYPNDPKKYGSDELVRAYTYAQILKNNGLEITEATLRAEEMRINQNTKSPETLAKIRALFKGDDEAFHRVFILPTYAERVIFFDFFSKSPKAQAKSLAKVSAFLGLISAPNADFDKVTQSEKLVAKRLTISKTEGLEWELPKAPPKSQAKANISNSADPVGSAPVSSTQEEARVRDHLLQQNRSRSKDAAQFWVENILPRLKPGEVLKEPIDIGEQWMIVKYEKLLPNGKFQLKAVMFPKDNYSEWLEAEKAKVAIRQ